MDVTGISRSIASGELPVAVVRVVERADLPHHLGAAGEAIDVALHLRPGSLTPVADARDAAQLVMRRAGEYDAVWNGWKPGVVDERFPFHAALMDGSGHWHVASLDPYVAGKRVVNAPLAGYVLNNSTDHIATRTTDELRLVAHRGFGFSFRPGDMQVAGRRIHEMPLRALGDTYRAPVVDAQVRRVVEHLDELAGTLDDIAPQRHGLELRPSIRLGDTGVSTAHAQRSAADQRLQDAIEELGRPMPDEVTTATPDAALRAAADQLRTTLRAVREDIATTYPRSHQETIDPDAWRPIIDRSRATLRALEGAPRAADQRPLAAFDALVERLRGASRDSREASIRSFRYEEFGRTPGERIRNFAVAYQALEDGVGFSDAAVARLKSWLRAIADDAATLRSELPEDQQKLVPLLDAVEEHARRNGVPGVVVNAQGIAGYDVFPDFAEIGRMSASLRTYLAIDDATGAARAAKDVPIAGELLTW